LVVAGYLGTLAVMRELGLKFALFVPMLFASAFASGAEIQVRLSPPEQTVKRGVTPQFTVTITAISPGQRVMKFAERHDLRDNYAQLVVTRDGKQVEVPRMISDPGPTGPNDYVQLDRNEQATFRHSGEPYMLSELSPGIYSAVVYLRTDWRSETVISNSVSLTVK
jgi:hypothetical protein